MIGERARKHEQRTRLQDEAVAEFLRDGLPEPYDKDFEAMEPTFELLDEMRDRITTDDRFTRPQQVALCTLLNKVFIRRMQSETALETIQQEGDNDE